MRSIWFVYVTGLDERLTLEGKAWVAAVCAELTGAASSACYLVAAMRGLVE